MVARYQVGINVPQPLAKMQLLSLPFDKVLVCAIGGDAGVDHLLWVEGVLSEEGPFDAKLAFIGYLVVTCSRVNL